MSLSESELDLARRVDWRFLLPTAELGRVACVGPLDGRLMRALARFADEVLLGDVVESGTVDVAVVQEATARRLAQAAALLRPGGWVYVESTGRDRRSVEDELARQGLEAIRVRWHWPGFDDCAEIVPLDEPEAVRLSLDRRRARTTSRVKARLARLLHTAGALDRIVPYASVVARRPGGDGPSSSYVSAFLSETPGLRLPERVVQPGVAGLLLTPGFETSRHVIALLVPRGDIHPALVGKTPRLAGDRASLATEATVLQDLEARGGPAAPRIVAFEEVHGRPLLLETAIVGTPMNPRAVAADPDGCIAAGLSWLAGLPVTVDVADEASFERLLAEPLARFASAAGPGVRGLVERTRAAVEPLRQARVPLVFEHGDLGHPNLLVQADGRLAVIDWELAEPAGLPLNDLCFFLAYVASARERATSLPDHVAAYERGFLARDAWARGILDTAAEEAGISRELVSPLVTATWMRYVLRLPERTGGAASRVVETRQYAFWERSLVNAPTPSGARI